MRRNRRYNNKSMLQGDNGLDSVVSHNGLLAKSGIVCSGILVLLLALMLFPSTHDSASAESGVMPLAADGPTTLSVSLQKAVELKLSPSSKGEFSTGTAEVSITTTNSDGYSVHMRTINEQNTLTNARGDVVAAVSGEVTSVGFGRNTWGYAFGKNLNPQTATYQAVPGNDTIIVPAKDTSDTAGVHDTYTLAFGAKVDTGLPAGEYTNGVVVSVIAEPVTRPDITTITTMQEMTMEICQATNEGVSATLTDARDDKSYLIVKAKDGNCWMAQDLDIKTGMVPKANVAGGTDGTYTINSNNSYYERAQSTYYTVIGATADTDLGATSHYINTNASICPTSDEADANWVLPKAGESGQAYSGVGSFTSLYDAYDYEWGSTKWDDVQNALQFTFGGYVNPANSSTIDYGSKAYYLSRTIAGSDNFYGLSFGKTSAINATDSTFARKYRGYLVRCLYPSTNTKSAVQAQ